MHYLTEECILKHGFPIYETRVNDYQVRKYFSYQGEKVFIDLFKLQTRDNQKETQTMTKLQQKKLELAKAQESKKQVESVKPSLSLEGFTLAKDLRNSIDGINSRLMVIESQNKSIIEKQEKLYTFLFNGESNNKELFTLLSEIKTVLQERKTENKKEELKTAKEEKKGETETTNNETTGNIIERFKKHFSGNFQEKDFEKFYSNCDFSSVETMEESFKVWNRESSNLMCARKSNKNFLASLWEVRPTKETTKGNKSDKIQSPVKSLKTFSDSLGIPIKTISEILEIVEAMDCFGDNEENEVYEMLLEENEEVNTESALEFIEFCRAKV